MGVTVNIKIQNEQRRKRQKKLKRNLCIENY